jgi:hypothetical protein
MVKSKRLLDGTGSIQPVIRVRRRMRSTLLGFCRQTDALPAAVLYLRTHPTSEGLEVTPFLIDEDSCDSPDCKGPSRMGHTEPVIFT